ncbi:hypothetical protein RFI_13086 [Reticulomyxa filosa]|uniref:Uncharacterized protein n=1 Tax=Reticulomyxa filosa TaxID=46433 RepID=X6NDJ1_RETFI|nr:hypothetical protein RFI_13086 [Reticulomyxa filosa]|eukprot:ETO24071.1 hypothetical protein RFI_13086 [Reticulomyxa filosa]
MMLEQPNDAAKTESIDAEKRPANNYKALPLCKPSLWEMFPRQTFGTKRFVVAKLALHKKTLLDFTDISSESKHVKVMEKNPNGQVKAPVSASNGKEREEMTTDKNDFSEQKEALHRKNIAPIFNEQNLRYNPFHPNSTGIEMIRMKPMRLWEHLLFFFFVYKNEWIDSLFALSQMIYP